MSAPPVTESTTRDRAPVLIAPEELAKTRVRTSFEISPVGHVMGDVAGLLGEHVLSLMSMFYPRNLCRKGNVVVTELVQNVVENVSDPTSAIRCEVEVDAEVLTIRVENRVTGDQWARVEKRVKEIHDAPDLRALVAKTIRERRANSQKGGLGLMRLAHENKFRIDAAFTTDGSDGRGTLRVAATFRVREKT
jgi:hypothetical protein